MGINYRGRHHVRRDENATREVIAIYSIHNNESLVKGWSRGDILPCASITRFQKKRAKRSSRRGG